ncbi:MAG TPA: hypothetical protein VM574_02235 [Terrimicrobiaceae bacterium]|jgi:hypothetical protein|nr:hypothetical protein [Terrimicrobiaceae bacterium]
MNILLPIGVVVWVTAWIVGVVNSVVMTRYLRKHEPAIAAEIGPPLLRKSIASDFRRVHFIFTRGYADALDSAFVRHGWTFTGAFLFCRE